MVNYKTFNANVKQLMLQLHASGAENGTVLQHLVDGELVNVVAAPCTTFLYSKNASGGIDVGVKLKSEAVVTKALDECDCVVTFANEAKYLALGQVNVKGRFVNPETDAGKEAIRRNECKWIGLAGNDLYLTARGKPYGTDSSVGTTVTGTSTCMQPAILCTTLLEGAVAPQTPPKAKASATSSAASPAASPAKTTAKKTTAKKTTPSVSLGKIKEKAGGRKVKATKRADIYAHVLAHSSNGQLQNILALYGYTHPAPKKKGKQPNAAVTRAALRGELRGFWGM